MTVLNWNLPRSLRAEGHMDEQGSESLADYVRRVRRQKNLSQGDVQRQAARRGYRIVGTYISRIENEIATNLSKDKLIALAHGLDVPESEVFAIVRGQPLSGPNHQEDILLSFFRQMPEHQRADVLAIVRALYDRALNPQDIHRPAKKKLRRLG
jgi:transcriptional regulator with XRE-family HTH domain